MTAPRPHGRLGGSIASHAQATRRLWAVLYRAVRYQAGRVDRLYAHVGRVTGSYRHDLEDLRRRVVALERRLDGDP